MAMPITESNLPPNDDQVLLRIIILFTEIVCFRYAMTPPNPPPSKQETDEYAVKHKVPDSMPLDVLWMAWWWRTFVYASALIEILALLPIPTTVPAVLQAVLPSPPPLHTVSLTPATLLSHILLLFGTFLRMHCYALLSRSFTYALSVRSDHKLITDGPYAIVRHPSYTGIFCLIVGNAVINFGRGGWWAWVLGFSESTSFAGASARGDGGVSVHWAIEMAYKAVGTAHILYLIPLPYIFAKRCVLEDKVMKDHFKEEWERWREKTPYRLIPYVW